MSFYSEVPVRSVRIAKPCEGCRTMIKVGERAIRYTSNHDGFFSCLYHPECRRAEVKLNDRHETYRHHDDWISLSDIEWNDYLWLVDVCPLVAVRMKITKARFEEISADHARRWSKKP